VTSQATDTAVAQAAQADINERSVQENIQSDQIQTKTRDKEQTHDLLMDSYISPPSPAWSANAESVSHAELLGYIQPTIEMFKSKLGTGTQAALSKPHDHTHWSHGEMSDSYLDNSSVISNGEYAFNSRQARQQFFDFLGAQQDANWDENDTYSTPNRHISLWIRSSVISSVRDRFDIGTVVNVEVSMQLIHTVTPGDSLFGNYEMETATITRQARGKDHANGYKAATAMALEQFMNPLQSNNYTQWFNENFSI